jgi:omega-6 fatty acid desaturase (delta-12 desaturase)
VNTQPEFISVPLLVTSRHIYLFISSFSWTVAAWVYKTFLGSPLKLWASVGHWAIWHFDLNKYTEQQRPRVLVSLAAVFTFMAVGWPLIIHYTGWVGFAKYWLMPWLGYHFWMSKCA